MDSFYGFYGFRSVYPQNGRRKMLSKLKSSQCLYTWSCYFASKNENIELSQQDCNDYDIMLLARIKR